MQSELIAPTRTEGPPPPRRPHSLRRTSSFQTYWPEGMAKSAEMVARARDLYTGDNPAAVSVAGDDSMIVALSPLRQIERMTASRSANIVEGFAGLAPGGQLRKAMIATMPEEIEQRTLLHRLLDDLAGATFASPTGWVAWRPDDWRDLYLAELKGAMAFDYEVKGICAGFRAGAPSLLADGSTNFALQKVTIGDAPFSEDDPIAWHEFSHREGPSHWRLKRTDVWLEGDQLHIDGWFQDSGTRRDGKRRIVHEYRLDAAMNIATKELVAMDVKTAVLPYGSCRAAAPNTEKLLGISLGSFGKEVSRILPGEVGCTHLNDVLRALADVVSMEDTLRRNLVEYA